MPPRMRGSALDPRKELLPVLREAPDAGSSGTSSRSAVGESTCSFAGFRLEADGTLWRGETVVHLPPKELAALRLLLANAGQVVSPLQLKHALWGDVHVTADSILKCLSSLRGRLEPELCIQTVYKRGYRFAAEVSWHSASSAAVPTRLAILPFATIYSVPVHLGQAIAEETMARLSNLRHPAFSILARDSVFALVRGGLTAEQIGQTLKADLVLTGTLRAFSSQFRLRAEMIRVEDGVQMWVEDLLVDYNRLAGVESELVERLAFRLAPVVPGERFSSSMRDNLIPQISASADGEADKDRRILQREAYDSYLRGHYEWQTLHRHRMQDGLQLLLRAIELDPSLISARVDLAHLCVTQSLYGYVSPAVAAAQVHRVEESIPDLPSRAPEFLPALGWVNFHFDRDLPTAIQAFSSSSHLPQGPWITRVRSIFTLSRHRFLEAIALLRAAIREDPYSPLLQSRLAWALHLNGQAAESVDQVRNALNIFPEDEFTKFYGALILAYNGESADSTQLAADLAQRLPFFDPATSIHAFTLACAGRKDEARAILERLQWLSRERYLLNCFNTAVHVALGDHDAAIEELRAANESRCPWFFQILADPLLKPLHGHPGFKQLQATLATLEAAAEGRS